MGTHERNDIYMLFLLSWINHWSITKLGAGEEFMASSYTYGLSDIANLFEKLG